MKLLYQPKNVLIRADRVVLANILSKWASEPRGAAYSTVIYTLFVMAVVVAWFMICKSIETFCLRFPQLTMLAAGSVLFCMAAHLSVRATTGVIARCYGGWAASLPVSYDDRLFAFRHFALREHLKMSALLGGALFATYVLCPAFRIPGVLFWGIVAMLGGEMGGGLFSLWRVTGPLANYPMPSFGQKLTFAASNMNQSPDSGPARTSLALLEHRRPRWLGLWQRQLASGRRGFAMRVMYGILGLGGSLLVNFTYSTNLASVLFGIFFAHIIFMSLCRLDPWSNPAISTEPIPFSALLFASAKTPMIVSLAIYSVSMGMGLMFKGHTYVFPLLGALIVLTLNVVFVLCMAVYPKDRIKGNMVYISTTMVAAGLMQVIGIFGIISIYVVAIYLYRLGGKYYGLP